MIDIVEGDCLDVMRAMPDGCVDTTVTSPPYNLQNSLRNDGKKANNFHGPGRKWKNCAIAEGYKDFNDCMPHADYVEWQRACLTEMWRLTSDDGVIFYNHKPRIQMGQVQLPTQFVPEHIPVRQIIIWNRMNGFNFQSTFFCPRHEYIMVMAKPGFRLTPKANGHGDVWSFNYAVKGDNTHPAPFPLELPLRCIESSPGQMVFDPFCGSGTTAVAAKQAGKDFIGIELSTEYCDIAKARVEAA